MTALATEYLTDLQQQLHSPRLHRDIRSRTALPELSRLTHVLARYHDQIANGFGTPAPDLTGVRDAARRAGTLLEQGEHLLGPPSDTETPASTLAQKLRAASIALGCGLDLLSTHSPPTQDQVTSANAVVIATPDTARALLHQLSTHTATVGHLARRTNAPTNQAGALLLKAAILDRIYSENRTASSIAALPLHHTPARIPPVIGEDDRQALAGIDASIQRLSAPAAFTSVTTWRYLARAAAIVCDLNSKTVRQLIHRINEMSRLHHVPVLKQAVADVQHTGRAWRTVIQRWDGHIGHYGHPANGPATDAGDLIVRLGRFIHADPAWTPSPRASGRLRPPHELAADLTQAADLAVVALKTIEACNNIAASQHAAINDAATIGVLDHQKKHPTQRPRVPASVRELSTRYDIAQTRGRQAILTLGQAIHNLTSQSADTLIEARLIIDRTLANAEQNQSPLAAAEFPRTIGNCLSKAPPSSSSQTSKVPTNQPNYQHRQQG
ncbi:hypothetical protein [Actinomadura macra]|uniref:hypothetical protein n=1 Tax=Actinomadura macra TaxID=46164 RepID=UPI0012FB15C3|nr:hypothetical protein [Actinomadura macra]